MIEDNDGTDLACRKPRLREQIIAALEEIKATPCSSEHDAALASRFGVTTNYIGMIRRRDHIVSRRERAARRAEIKEAIAAIGNDRSYIEAIASRFGVSQSYVYQLWPDHDDPLAKISANNALKIVAMLIAGVDRNDIAKAMRRPLNMVNRVENAWRQLSDHFLTSHGSAHGTGQCSTDPGRSVSDASATDPNAPASR